MDLTAILPTVRVTPEAKTELEKEAAQADRSLSAHIRYLLMNRKKKFR